MGEDNSVIARTPDKYYILDSFYQKKTGNSEYLELTLDAFRLESAIQNQELAIIESLKNNTNVSVFDHQILAAKKMINEFGCTGLLADEVGLGKTVEAGIIIKELLVTGIINNVLILTPPSLVPQWQAELSDKFNLDFIKQIDDDRFINCGVHDFLVMSHSSAIQSKNEILLNQKTWDLVVVDEAHSMKNAETIKHKMVKNLMKKRLLLLSATPIQNDLKELYNMIELLHPSLLGTWKEFKRKFVQDKNIREINPTHRLILQDIISDLIIRNTRKEVSKYIDFTKRIPNNHILEPKTNEKLLYDLVTEKLRELYLSGSCGEMIVMSYQKYISSSTAATKQAVNRMKKSNLISSDEYDEFINHANSIEIDSKMEHILKIIQKDKSKFLIFCEFYATQNYIAKVLEDHGFLTTLFNGTMTPEEKISSVNSFKQDVQILISTGAGGEGQNLQFCHNIVNYDLPWNPMKVEQRIGRVHRIGQKHDVNIHNYAIDGTIEAYILELLYVKIELFTLAIGDMDVMFEGISSGDITKSFFDDYMKSKNEDDLKNKFTVLGEEWKTNRGYVSDVVHTFNKNVFKNFDLGSVEKNE